MRSHRNRTRNIMIVVIFVLVCVGVPTLLIIPYGSRVHAVATLADNSLDIQSCYLKKMYGLNMMDPENTVTAGNRTVKMTVLNANTQSEIFSTTKTQIGTGNCVLDSPTLPNLDINTQLSIQFQLLDSSGNLIAQNETTIIYK